MTVTGTPLESCPTCGAIIFKGLVAYMNGARRLCCLPCNAEMLALFRYTPQPDYRTPMTAETFRRGVREGLL